MVFKIFIIRPNWSNTSLNILLYSFLVQNNTSNIKYGFECTICAFYILLFLSVTQPGVKRTAAGRRRLTNRLRLAIVDHVPPSASYHQSRSMVGGGGWWHSRRRPIEHRIRRLFRHSCRPFSAHFVCRALQRLSKKTIALENHVFYFISKIATC